MFPVEKYKFIHSLVRRVAVYESEVRIAFYAEGIVTLLKEAGLDVNISTKNSGVECVLTVLCKLRRYGGLVKLHSADAADEPRLPIQTALIQKTAILEVLTHFKRGGWTITNLV